MFEPHKYEHAQDRQITLSDIKGRIIDLTENRFALPDVAWDAEPVRYFKLNEKWCAIVFGLLDWLEDPAGWLEAVDDNFPGIQGILAFEVGIEPPILPPEGDCLNYAPSASFIDYLPQNPYNNPDYIPPDYLVPPFLVNDDLEYPELIGYQATDVFVPFGAITIDPIDLVTFNLPRLEISVRGGGQIELDFLAVAFGGLVVIKVGEMPNIADIILENVIDTGVQILDLEVPAGTIPHPGNIRRSTEVNIEAAADETTIVYVVFCPKLNESVIPLAFGGGIRGLQLCGFEGEAGTMVYQDTRFNQETCSFEKRIDGVWSVIDGNEYWLECVRALMATKQEVKEAILESAQEIAARFLSGQANFEDGVCIDEDGNVSVGTPGGSDDPDTPQNEASEARSGGVIGIRTGYNRFYADVIGWIDDGLAAATIWPRVQAIYKVNETMEAALLEFQTDYEGAVTVIEAFTDDLDSWLFCEGITRQKIAAYIVTLTPANAVETGLLVNSGFLDEQISDWYNAGAQLPSTAYFEYGCVPVDTEEWTFDFSLSDFPQRTTGVVHKHGHRLLIEASGKFVDTDNAGEERDILYHKSALGAITFESMQMNSVGLVPGDFATQAKVPYEPSGVYRWTVDLLNNPGEDSAIIFGRLNGGFNLPGTSGIITMKVTDLGEWA